MPTQHPILHKNCIPLENVIIFHLHSPAPAPKKKAAPAPVAPVEESPAGPKVPGKYVPPSQRNGGTPASSGTPGMFPHSRRKKEAPNVNSEVDFPTLGGGGGR